MIRLAHSSLLLLILMLTGCSSIDINNVEPEKLEAKVNLTQTGRSTSVDLFLSRGLWNQPVSADNSTIVAELANGERIPLVAAQKKGRYGFRNQGNLPITSLSLEPVGTIEFPDMPAVVLNGIERFEGGSFFKDDMLNLSLPSTQSDQRYLVATGYCGSQPFTAEQKISSNQVDLELPLSRIMNMVNQTAEADLNGIIPITLAIEERYFPVWSAPFVAGKIATRDETQFSIDTSGFRFKAQLTLKVAENAFFSFQNQHWDVKYCY